MCEKFIICLIKILFCFNAIESRNLLINDTNGRIFCGVDEIPPENELIQSIPKPHRRQFDNSATIELGVFYEPYLRQKFNYDETKLKEYLKTILSGTQTVFRYPSMRSKVELVVTRFEMIPEHVIPHEAILQYNTSQKTLNELCRWQWETYGSVNRQNYDLALFLLRTTLYHNGGLIEGLANLDSVCFTSDKAKQKTCAIGNVSYLDSVWVIAHEIMHTFGIRHLTKHCEPSGIMHRTSSGPFYWTNCTNDAFEKFLSWSTCLFNSVGTPLSDWDLNAFPFHWMSMSEQCASNFGPKYYSHSHYSKYCTILICEYDLFATIYNPRPPLEGTECGNSEMGWGKCKLGECLVNSNG